MKGQHLIAAGIKPGIQFGNLLKAAYEYQLENNCEDVGILLDYVIKQIKNK